MLKTKQTVTWQDLNELERKLSYLICDLQEQINELKYAKYNNIYDFIKEKSENYIVGRHTNCYELEMINKLLKKTFNGIGHIVIRHNKNENDFVNAYMNEGIKKHKVFIFDDAILLNDVIKKCEDIIEKESEDN